jgi:hypothetical protein
MYDKYIDILFDNFPPNEEGPVEARVDEINKIGAIAE